MTRAGASAPLMYLTTVIRRSLRAGLVRENRIVQDGRERISLKVVAGW